MISIKSSDEIRKITKSCKILAEVKDIIFDFIRPGVSLKELDQIAFKEITKRGAKPAFLGYNGFPKTLCTSVNEVLIHGIPDNYILKDQDLLSVDLGAIYEGYYSDSAFSIGVGPTLNEENEFLIEVAFEAFHRGIEAIKPGAHTGDIGAAIGTYLKSKNLFTPQDYSGHGIGAHLHEDPAIFNYGHPGKGTLLRDNMVICIEPMILQESNKIFVEKDNWTVVSSSLKKSAHYEETILIKNGKPIILTKGISFGKRRN